MPHQTGADTSISAIARISVIVAGIWAGSITDLSHAGPLPQEIVNGNVTFTFGSVEPTPDAEIAPAVAVTNLWDYWADHEWEPLPLCESGPC